MFDLPLHPAIVHLPLGLTIMMPLVFMVIWYAIHKKWLPSKSWFLVILFQIILFGSGFIAMELGEKDAEIIEKTISENVIENHEEKAEVFVGFSGAVCFLLIILFLVPEKYKNLYLSFLLLIIFTNLILGLNVGHSGGEIVYKNLNKNQIPSLYQNNDYDDD